MASTNITANNAKVHLCMVVSPQLSPTTNVDLGHWLQKKPAEMAGFHSLRIGRYQTPKPNGPTPKPTNGRL
jgi:hypothetical protein